VIDDQRDDRHDAAAFRDGPIAALRAMREELWDPARGMDRYAPGVVPGVDLAALNLHAVRETALGAWVDLGDGTIGRAVTALRNVLALQYVTPGVPWSGTFPVSAEQADPPGTDAVEWVHYDPNWRQFVGCTLALCRIAHGADLPDDVRAGIGVALDRCVAGEPDGRIARWYTNPNLMHAWLQGHVGTTTGDAGLVERAHARVASIMERFERHGDLDEYNSPTYDGVDLWALGIWATHPPTPPFADAAAAILPRVGARISTLHHPQFGTTCGPYIRAYGLDPTRYVSLSGLVAARCGEPADRVLPPVLDPDTDHVHDLYFAPVIDHVAEALTPHLQYAPVTGERLHEQRFTASVATSVLRPDLAVGWEHGRRHQASLDQYVPFTAHTAHDGRRAAFGIMLPAETAWIDVHRTGDLEFELRASGGNDGVGIRVVGTAPTIDAVGTVSSGRCRVEFAGAAAEVFDRTTPAGPRLHLRWPTSEVTGRITVDA
jgi:hypothetical protein